MDLTSANIKLVGSSRRSRSTSHQASAVTKPTLILSFTAGLLLTVASLKFVDSLNLSRPDTRQSPSQLFLAPANLPVGQISLVNGYHAKKPLNEENDGFIMQTNSTETSTTPKAAEETSTSPPEELQPEEGSSSTEMAIRGTLDQADSIPIDANRQQFVTHDQLSMSGLNLNASTKDESINLTTNSKGTDEEGDQNPVRRMLEKSSRAGISKVSHVASFFSAASPTSCPGVCRSIFTPTIFCRNEIGASCPSFFQKCCDKDDSTLNGTPVETSAPIPAGDTDASGSQPSNAPNITTPIPQVSMTTNKPLSVQESNKTANIVEQQHLEELNRAANSSGSSVEISHGSPIYFLSSGTDSAESEGSRSEIPIDRKDSGQEASSKKVVASQSFDLERRKVETTTTEAPNTIRQNKVVIVHTANGTILHKPGELRQRPAYANLTDYRLALMAHSNKPTGSNHHFVYHSNIDPVKKFLADNPTAITTGRPSTTLTTPTSTTSSTTTTTTTTTTPPPTTTSQSPTSRGPDSNQQSESASQLASGVGSVLAELLDSWISGTSTSASSQDSERPAEGGGGGGGGGELADSMEQIDKNGMEAHATDQMASFSVPESQNPEQQNDRRLGFDVSFRQQTPTAPQHENISRNDGYTSPGNDLTFLMTSDGGSEQVAPGSYVDQKQSNTQQQQVGAKCAGYCTLQLFTMLCDSTYKSADCSAPLKCCVIDRGLGTSPKASPTDESEQPTEHSSNRVQSVVSNGNQPSRDHQQACRGSCLPVYHSNLCTKPNRIQLESPSCLPDQVCCATGNQLDAAEGNQLDDMEGLLSSQSSSSSEPAVQPAVSHNEQQNMLRDNYLLASLLPPPPPSVQASDHQVTPEKGANQLMGGPTSGEQYLQATARQRAPGFSAGDQLPSNYQIYLQPAPPRPAATTTTVPAAPKTSQTASQGIMSQIYQTLFKSAGQSKQRQRQPTPAPSVPQHQHQQFLVHQMAYEPYQQVQPQQVVSLSMRPAQPATGLSAAASQQMMFPVYHQAPTAMQINPGMYQSQLAVNQQQQYQQVVEGQPKVVNIPMAYQQQIKPNMVITNEAAHQQMLASEIANPTMANFAAAGNYETNKQLAGTDSIGNGSKQQKQRPAVQFGPFQSSFAGSGDMRQLQSGNNYKPLTTDGTFVAAPMSPHNRQQQHRNQLQHPVGSFGANESNNGQKSASNNLEQQQRHQVQVARPLVGQQQQQQSFKGHHQSNGFVGLRPVSPPGSDRLDSSNVDQASKAQVQQIAIATNRSPAVPNKNSLSQFGQQQQYQPAGSQVVNRPNPVRPQSQQQQQPQQHPQDPLLSTTMAPGEQQAAGSKQQVVKSLSSQPTEHRQQQQSGLSPSSSNLNVHHASNGPFGLEQIKFEPIRRQNQAGQTGASKQSHPNPDDLSNSELQFCPGGCMAPFAAFNCQPPGRLDENFACSAPGAICCIRPATISRPAAPQAQPEEAKRDPLQQQQQQPQSPSPQISLSPQSSGVVSMLDGNKLDPAPEPELDQLSDESNKQHVAAEQDAEPELQQQIAGKSKAHGSSCGIPGPRKTGRLSSGYARGRVMGGFDAKPDYWCWQAALMNSKNEYLCGGALIGTKWVLTAAHCVTQHVRSESQLYVRLGQHDLNNATQASTRRARTIQVKTSYVHHNHNSVTLDNDIALLRLEEAVDLEDPDSSGICLVCLPERSSQTEAGKRCTVTGYGFENEDGPAALRVRQTELPIVADQECQNKTSLVLGKPFTLPASSFCAGGELGQDACHGDGGSPLSCLVDGYHELTGIVSWGYKCGSKDLPGLYSKVSAFVGWINQIVSVNN